MAPQRKTFPRLFLARAAGDDHARYAGVDEPPDRVLRERIAGDGNERLRQALRRLSQALRGAAREEERLHYVRSFGSTERRPGSAGDACRGRPMPS